MTTDTHAEQASVANGELRRSARRERMEDALIPPLVAIIIALVIGDLLILAFGQSPRLVYRLLIEGTWGNPYGFGQVIYRTATLTCTGLAFAIAARAGLFNIGAESQLAAGGFAAGVLGTFLPGGLPLLIAAPILIAAAVAGGGTVGLIPGWLKSRMGANEVVVTIMLNFVVLALLNWAMSAHFAESATTHTHEIASGFIPRLSTVFPGLHGSAANFSVLVIFAAAAWLAWWLFRTGGGYELRAVGLQPNAAAYAGVDVGRTWMRAMMLSGAVAGLGGINFVLGYKHYYEEGFASGSGFLGIAVALVGRNHPLGIVLAALFFATLSQGGFAVNAVVPREFVGILQAVVILAVVASTPAVRSTLRSARGRAPTLSTGKAA